ncbi:metallophosphoesterase family protein [Sinorhizobium meliloti]|uniref:metallophosphoesterase family protein n=1 Tax=Rhizobium meliloti TaxID=382 RepID=UPI000FDACEF4|nr:DNA repair exonuclease [Sinorhizobium meliloti]MDW9928061.1 DNA repair exonuclease [Sinorhizobium meliloti]MDX0964789.1 DNA repair exonuclease [Sinorhizobium medicae]RVI54941.1 DNA repair exonuclease [Sinorhizobium meliloti]
MAYRFLHTADIHLDSPLKTLALRNPELSDLIGVATRRAFIRVVDLCLEERVDALVLAGDLYDGDQTSMKTARFLAEQLRRLHEAGVRTFIIRGNHDALSKITAELLMPETVKVFGASAEAVAIDRGAGNFPVAIHGLSFAKPHAPQSLLRHYALPVPDAVNIGIMHTSLGGSEKHDPYAPCSVADLQQSGFRYWALGHIHKRSVVEDAASVIVMPGMPQGRDINEDGPKSVSLVTIRDDRSVIVEERHTSVAQFERLVVDASHVSEWKDMIAQISTGLEALRSAVAADHLVARIQLHGSNELAWRVRRDLDLLRTEMETRGSMIGNVWIDKVQTSCSTPGGIGSGAGALSELSSIIDGEVSSSTAYQQELISIAEELRAQLPAELRDIFGTDEASFKDVLANIARDGSSEVVARLRGAVGE